MRGKLIVLMCLCAVLTGCSNKAFGGDAGGWKDADSMTEYDNRSKSDESRPESSKNEIVTVSEYHSLDDDEFIKSETVDGGLAVLKENANLYYNESSPYYIKTLKLDSGGGFEFWENVAADDQPECVFTGSYTVGDDGVIEFEYEKYREGETVLAVSEIGDMPGKMRSMNTTGSYADYINPPAAQVKKDDIFSTLPIMLRLPMTDLPYAITTGLYDMELIRRDDLLCARTYGAELTGSYDVGKDFVLDFDPVAIYTENSLYQDETLYDKAQKDELIKAVRDTIGTDGSTKVSFSSGRWTWTRDDGTEISAGSYSESSDHPGLIKMLPDTMTSNMMVSWFYITDDGIYYPYMVMTKQEER